MSRQSQSRPVSGISSESLLPNQQSFALSSDKKLLMGPQDRERDASVSSPLLFQNQKNTEACTKSSLEPLNRKRKRKESSDPIKKVKIQNVNNHLNSEVVEFEKKVREGGVLKLLEFENENLEKRFRSAMEGFLSPNLPRIAPRKNVKVSYKGDRDNLEGKDEDEHLIPQFDLKSRLNLMETMKADEERHERSRCLNGNGKKIKGANEKHSHYFLIVFSNLSENTTARIGRLWKEIIGEDSGVSQMIDFSARVLQHASKSEVTPEYVLISFIYFCFYLFRNNLVGYLVGINPLLLLLQFGILLGFCEDLFTELLGENFFIEHLFISKNVLTFPNNADQINSWSQLILILILCSSLADSFLYMFLL